jgi:hypothetical protein
MRPTLVGLVTFAGVSAAGVVTWLERRAVLSP